VAGERGGLDAAAEASRWDEPAGPLLVLAAVRAAAPAAQGT
jgi:hypothetical protein